MGANAHSQARPGPLLTAEKLKVNISRVCRMTGFLNVDSVAGLGFQCRFPELMPGPQDKYVFERRLGQRYRRDRLAKCIHQIAEELMPARSLYPQAVADSMRRDGEPLMNPVCQASGVSSLNREAVATN